MSGLLAGIGQVDYTPEPGLPLMGNFRDEYGARGVHDPLHGKAVVVGNSSKDLFALLSIDICVVGRDGVDVVRQYIASHTDLSPDRILVAATHTHSAPAAVAFGSLPRSEDGAAQAFLKRAAEAAVLAWEDLKDSSISVGYACEDRVSFNRRLRCKDGQTHMNWEKLDPSFVCEPLGPIDPQVIVAQIERQGQPAAALVNFGLHAAVLAGDNWLYSADYPAYLAEALSKVYGQDFVTLFFNGCCGDVNHIDYRDLTQGRGYQMTQRIGYMLGVDCLEAMTSRIAVEGDCIGVSKEDVRLERLKVSEERREWCEGVVEEAGKNPARGREDGLPDEHFARLGLEMYEQQGQDDEAEVMVVRVGDLGIVGLPAEVFCEYGLDIKQRSPAKHTLVVELANGWHGYIPTRAAFDQGGYESMPGSTFYTEGAGKRLVGSALRQLEGLFS